LPPSDGSGTLTGVLTSGLLVAAGLPSAVQSWRAPRLQILANGIPLQGVVEVDVMANNHYAADRFRAVLALGQDSSATSAFWSSQSDILVDAQFSLDGGVTFVSLVQGLVDTIAIDVMAGSLVLEGRDLTAALIESRTQETFANRTSSEIATILAQRHNLVAAVTPTTTPVGRYYQNEHDRVTLNQFSRSMTEWDLLIFLAGQEGFDVFISGNTLCFQPTASGTTIPYTVTPANLQDLRLERSLTLARDIEVTVKSWNSRQQSAFSQTVRASGQPDDE
jgi:hypothetical protein